MVVRNLHELSSTWQVICAHRSLCRVQIIALASDVDNTSDNIFYYHFQSPDRIIQLLHSRVVSWGENVLAVPVGQKFCPRKRAPRFVRHSVSITAVKRCYLGDFL